MSNATGIWVYRVAFFGAAGLVLGLMHFIVFARATWFPAYEEKMLTQMLRVADEFAPDAKHKGAKKPAQKKNKMAPKSRRAEVKQ